MLDTIIFSSFLKAKYILLDAQASIQLITSLTSHVCSGHFSHIDYATQNLHPDLLTGFIIYSFTKHKRINERHSVKYCEMMGQINFAFKATVINISFNRLLYHIWLLFVLIHITYCITHCYIHRKFRQAFLWGPSDFFQIHSFPSSFCNWCLRCPLHPVIIDSFKALKLYRLLCCRVCKSIYRWVSTYCLSEHSWLRSCSKDAELCASVLNYSNSYNRDSKKPI